MVSESIFSSLHIQFELDGYFEQGEKDGTVRKRLQNEDSKKGFQDPHHTFYDILAWFHFHLDKQE